MNGELCIRSAKVSDAGRIMRLINELAVRQVMLPRSPASVIEHIRDFVVAELDGEFVGCAALHVIWSDMGEIRSIAVHPDAQKGGIGRAMADRLIEVAVELGLPKIYCFTYVPGFFEKLGFEVVTHRELPHKMFNDCKNCPKFTACDEIAMLRVLRAPTPEEEAEGPTLPSRPVRLT
ncbi:MAG: N-acetyltransferase [Planctomycetota bacterium]|jgi:amino-acid N-acetyltransferase|nr:N-acetyltransferase [Planctomycetota bacterium]MDA0933405.1 N-acetyltransferase [Planctomycetota bacterium]MDA1221288.1 N-acetyltransferase [Planctomycetota bacterium]